MSVTPAFFKMRKVINIKHNCGDIVCLKARPGQSLIVTGYLVRNRMVSYLLSDGNDEAAHMDIEIANSKSNRIKGFESGKKEGYQ
jgi:hypothetical protein